MRLLCFLLLLTFSFCSSQQQTEKYCLSGSIIKDGQFDEVVTHKTVDGFCDCSFTVDCKEAKCSTIKSVFFQCDPNGTYSSYYESTHLYILYKKAECEVLEKCNEKLFRNLHNEYKTLLWGLKPESERENLMETWRSGMYSIVRRDGGGTGKVETHDHTPWLLLVIGGVLFSTSGVPLFYIVFIEKQKHSHDEMTLESPDGSKEKADPPVKPLELDTLFNMEKKNK